MPRYQFVFDLAPPWPLVEQIIRPLLLSWNASPFVISFNSLFYFCSVGNFADCIKKHFHIQDGFLGYVYASSTDRFVLDTMTFGNYFPNSG